MKSRIFTILMAGILGWLGAKGQTYPLVKIHDIQYMPTDTLANCHFKCAYNNDTVRIRGIAVMKGNQSTAYLSSANKPTTREIYIQDGSGPNSGIDVFTIGSGTVTSPQDIFSLIPGDSVEITGLVSVYDGQIEIEPITKTAGGVTFTQNVKYLGVSKYGAKYTTVPISQMVNSKSINQLSTGEQWESVYINLQNVTVTSVPTGSRTQFTVADSAGNYLTVFDRFYVQRDGVNGNTFKVPHVGDIFKSLKGVISGYATTGPNCSSGTYEMYPFDSTDYTYSLSAPIINFVSRSPLVPKSTNAVTVTVNVTPFGTRSIKNVMLYYKTGADTSILSGYTEVAMTASGANYVATIPAEANGTSVKYWVTAVDTITLNPLRSYSPNIKAANVFPYFYTVRDGGMTIYDVQFRPMVAAPSPYVNDTVTVSGVVTASLSDLGYFYVQQPGLKSWGGINLKGSSLLANFKTGDNITVSGVVNESSNYTSLLVTNISKSSATATISPISLNDTLLKGGDLNYRQYMGMLTTLKPIGSKLHIIQLDADGTSNFGDYRVGESISTPTLGTRVSSGNSSSSDPQSTNISYVNDSTWFLNPNKMKYRVLTTSDNMDSISGIMFYNFSNYKLLPRNNADIHNITNPIVTSTHNSGIEGETTINQSFTVFPNPSSGDFHLVISNPQAGEMNLKVIDLTGKTVYAQNINGNAVQQDIHLNNLNAGMYMLILGNANGTVGETKLLINK